MKDTISKYKWQIVGSFALLLVPMLAGLLLWEQFPDVMTSHWGADGSPDGSAGKGWFVFGLPLILMALHGIAILATAADPGNRFQSGKAMGLVFYLVPVLSLGIHGFVYGMALGWDMGLNRWMMALLGLMFLVIGNYLPKMRRNSTLGIKLPWTLADEENWNRTHRLGGKIWVAAGIVMLIALFLPERMALSALLLVLLAAAIVPAVYSYCLYRRRRFEAGVETLAPMTQWRQVIMPLVIIAFVLVMLFTGSITFTLGDEALVIKSSYFNGVTLPYEDIVSMELRESHDAGVRTNGFGSPKLTMGTFRNGEFGSYTRYAYTGQEVCIVIHRDNGTLILACQTPEDTRVLYRALQEKLG